ncbi:CocE/NonD family hydrolase [Cupriavidus alkaliphilus]|uniref:CocE/NonD family hydrolase n=1 Tax=Cupriavidus alkaliphilus TaxID=942866 RepID=UPI001616BE35|nr:CocE/NonD family hydrolase [Cupriavidus alkaliphilus]MBB2917077.1 hypothetical protein [Cupriavidus alkaliphilus]
MQVPVRLAAPVAAFAAHVLVGCGGSSDGNSSVATAPPPVVKDGISCTVEMMPTRDGVKLYTEVYKPVGNGKYPVIMARNPYGRLLGDGCFSGFLGSTAAAQASRGYVVIGQEVRGTNKSEGTFTPFVQEQNDGYDAVQWAAAQPWSNGKVGLTGGSYLGVTQWQAAITSPPNLFAFTPAITATDYHDDFVGRNGVFDVELAHRWGLIFVPDAMARQLAAQGLSDEAITARVNEWQATQTANMNWNSALPLTGEWNATAKSLAPYIWDWYSHPTYDDFWAKIDVQRQFSQVKVPALVSGGWYDILANGTIDGFLGLKQSGGTPEARDGTMLVMDCCGHGLAKADPGQVTWGQNKTNVEALTTKFLDKYLQGNDNGLDNEPRVQLSVLVPPDSGTSGDNFMFRTTAYPVPGTVNRAFFLSSGGNANTSSGDGSLSATIGSQGPADSFTYDPLDPVPTRGGKDASQAFDQSEIEKRMDVLVYTSDLLTEPMAVIGAVKVRFWAKTTAADTDFTAKLVDVHPDGYAHNVVDSIVRARYRHGSKSLPDPITPNTPYEYELKLGHTATLFKPGHRIRLEISSSNFPHYQRNLNTGDSNETTSTAVTARQTILHDTEHPSVLFLPVVPGVAPPQ